SGLWGGGESAGLAREDVAKGLGAGETLLGDVRDPNETAIERTPGSVLAPLSTFAPADLPDPEGRAVVFSCASGIRSIKAAEIAQAAGLPHNAHLVGGIKAWKAAGLPIEV